MRGATSPLPPTRLHVVALS